MKNLIVNKGQKCERCNDPDVFQVTTPIGADYTTCPLCGNWTDDITEEEDTLLEKLEEEINKWYYYCKRCNIIYDLGCYHAINGCTDNIYYGKVVKEYKEKEKDNKIIGMPQFDSIQEYVTLIKQLELIWECKCKLNGDCKRCPNQKYKEFIKDCKCNI